MRVRRNQGYDAAQTRPETTSRAESRSAACEAAHPNASTLQWEHWHCEPHRNQHSTGMGTAAARAHSVYVEGAILNAAAEHDPRRRLICREQHQSQWLVRLPFPSL
jgi:hypothetical protein